MTEIRLRYTGLTAYVTSLLTTFTGLLFTLLITRRLTPDELGVWRYIGSLIAYFVIPPGLVAYWTTRLTAQGKQVLSTSLLIATISAVITTPVFMTLSKAFSEQVNAHYSLFMMAAIEIPLISVYMILESALTARRPERVYYSIMMQELVKLPVAIAFVLVFRLGVLGAILAAVVGFGIRVLTSFFLAKEIGFGRPEWGVASQILRHIWLPLYSGLPNALGELQFIAVVLILGSSEVLGYVSAVLLVGSVVALAGNLSSGLYPKLLQSQSSTAVETSLKMVLMIAIPSSVGGIILSEHILNLLRPDYRMVAPALAIALPSTILYLINNILDATLIGQERADFDNSSDFKKLIKSWLFLVPTINIVHSIAYIVSLALVLLYFSKSGILTIVIIWFVIHFSISIPFLVYKIKVSNQSSIFRRILLPVTKYILSAMMMGGVIFIFRPANIPSQIFFSFPLLLPVIIAGIITYFGILYIIDEEFRSLARLIVSNTRSIFKIPHY